MDKKQKAFELDSLGLCVICEVAQAERRRGLCGKHYEQYRRAKLAMNPDEIEEFEAIAIENGQLMPSVQGKKPGAENIFADLAAAIRLKHAHAAEDREPYSSEHPTIEDAKEIVADAVRKGGRPKDTAKKTDKSPKRKAN
jgi:hypothetical protein